MLEHAPRRLVSRTALALTLAGAATLGLSPSTPATAADTETETAPELGALVARTAAELTEGTLRLEQGQARVAELQTRQELTRAQSRAAAESALAARARLGELVGAQYRNPQPTAAVLVLAAGSAGFAETVHALAGLEQVRGSQQSALAEADLQRRAAERLVAEADRLAADAAQQRDALAVEVADLGRRAQDAGDQLARAQALQDERASRDRSPAAAPPPAVVLGGGASCGGGDLTGYANGMLATSALCPLDGTDGLVLRADAAAAFNRMAAAGGMPCAGNSYRSYSEQVALYRVKPSLAAVPGTSNHGWGVAVDFACGAESFGSSAYRWLTANGPAYGWTHPSWAEAGGKRPEPWHWEYTG